MTEYTERHRPRTLEKMVLPDSLRALLHQAARTGDVPNLLMYGPAGTGKTTAARVLLRRYFFPPDGESVPAAMVGRSPLDLDVLTLNASDDRSLDMVRQQLRQFMKLAPCPGNPRGLRFVVLDEFDAMTKPAQLALKMLIRDQHADCGERGSGGVRFLLICNYLSRIDPALREELVCLRFNALPPAAVDAFLRQVVRAEGLAARTDAQLAELRARHGGSDLRAMLHALQAEEGSGGGGAAAEEQAEDGGGDDGPPQSTEAGLRTLRAHVLADSSAADRWTDRERRAAILLFQATDLPERAVDATVRRNALAHLLAA